MPAQHARVAPMVADDSPDIMDALLPGPSPGNERKGLVMDITMDPKHKDAALSASVCTVQKLHQALNSGGLGSVEQQGGCSCPQAKALQDLQISRMS